MTHTQSLAAAAHEDYGSGVPTQPGYYWYRNVKSPSRGVWDVCSVRLIDGDLVVSNESQRGSLSHAIAACEFRGPILPPDTNAASSRKEGM